MRKLRALSCAFLPESRGGRAIFRKYFSRRNARRIAWLRGILKRSTYKRVCSPGKSRKTRSFVRLDSLRDQPSFPAILRTRGCNQESRGGAEKPSGASSSPRIAEFSSPRWSRDDDNRREFAVVESHFPIWSFSRSLATARPWKERPAELPFVRPRLARARRRSSSCSAARQPSCPREFRAESSLSHSSGATEKRATDQIGVLANERILTVTHKYSLFISRTSPCTRLNSPTRCNRSHFLVKCIDCVLIRHLMLLMSFESMIFFLFFKF